MHAQPEQSHRDAALRRAVVLVAALNLSYFCIEFAVAIHIGSVSLFADSVDFLEDASINILIAIAIGWSLQNRARLGMLLAAIMLIPGLAFLWTVWQKFLAPIPPNPHWLTVTGMGALIVNVSCAFLLARFRHHQGSLSKAAFLSARNDAIANIAIIGAGLTTLIWFSTWPDVIVGVAIMLMNLDAAKSVWLAAKAEKEAAEH